MKCSHTNFVECMELVSQKDVDEICMIFDGLPMKNLGLYSKLQVALCNNDVNSIIKTS